MSDEQAEEMEYEQFYNKAYGILEKREYNPTADYLDGLKLDEVKIRWSYYSNIPKKIMKDGI